MEGKALIFALYFTVAAIAERTLQNDTMSVPYFRISDIKNHLVEGTQTSTDQLMSISGARSIDTNTSVKFSEAASSNNNANASGIGSMVGRRLGEEGGTFIPDSPFVLLEQTNNQENEDVFPRGSTVYGTSVFRVPEPVSIDSFLQNIGASSLIPGSINLTTNTALLGNPNFEFPVNQVQGQELNLGMIVGRLLDEENGTFIPPGPLVVLTDITTSRDTVATEGTNDNQLPKDWEPVTSQSSESSNSASAPDDSVAVNTEGSNTPINDIATDVAKDQDDEEDVDTDSDDPIIGPGPNPDTSSGLNNNADDAATKEDIAEAINDLLKHKENSNLADMASKIPNAVVAKLDTEYTIISNILVYTLDSDLADDEYIVVELTGIGEANFVIINGKEPYASVTDTITIESFSGANLMPVSAQYLQKKSSLVVGASNLMLATMTATFRRVKSLKMGFNENLQIIPAFSEFVKIKLSSPASLINTTKESRIQFIVESSLQDQRLADHQELDMFINQKAGTFPTPTNSEMKASGSIGYGLIKTLSPKDSNYCADPSCNYYVTLKIHNVKNINFFPTIFDNNSEIKFHAMLSLLEELEPADVVTYKLVVPKTEQNWIFTITPTGGHPTMYLNPDNKPSELKDYAYKAVGNGRQSIIVTAKEAVAKSYSHMVFYVTYSSLDSNVSSTFKFEAKREEADTSYILKENQSYTGVLVDKELISYILELRTPRTEEVSTEIKLTVSSNDVTMIVKECLEEDLDCDINEKDIENANTEDIQSLYSNRIVKKTAVGESIDREIDMNILLNFKCTPGKPVNKSANLLVSSTCNFAVGVIGKAKGNSMVGTYSLTTKNQNTHIYVEIKTPTQISLRTDEVINYKLEVPKDIKANFKFAMFTVTALNGNCNIYISRTTLTPNKNDFENIIEVTDDNVTSLETFVFYSSIDLDNLPKGNAVYLSAVGTDYCIVEMYADFTNQADRVKNVAQEVEENHFAISHMDDEDIFESMTGKIYSKLFVFEIPPYNKEIGFLTITVNANKLGLNICVQENVEAFDYMKGCDYFKDSDVLTISRYYRADDAGTKLFISVRKPVQQSDSFSNFPTEFSVLVSFDKNPDSEIKIIAAGQSHSKLLPSLASVIYQLNANYMIEAGLILLSTDHPSLRAFITASADEDAESIAVLTQNKFAMRIKKVFEFKQNYCKSQECSLFVKVYNASAHSYRFTLTYTVDDYPIALKDGAQVFVPSDMPQYFIAEADSDKPLVFNLSSESTSGVVYSKVHNIMEIRKNYIYDLLDEVKFDYKSKVGTEIEITQAPGVLKNFNPPIVGYYYAPKFNVTKSDGMIVVYDQKDRAKVRLHSNILKLEPYSQTRFSTQKKDYSYFYINVDEVQGFSVILSVITGEADLYINPGMFNFTTSDVYWQKSASYKGDEITITEDMFADPENVVGTYTVGVHARTDSEYSILFMPEFSNLIKMHYQSLVYLKLEKEKYYYFDFFNKHKTITTYFYSETSDVELSVLNYDESKDQEFIDMIAKENNYSNKVYFVHGSKPLKHISSSAADLGTHYVIRVKALMNDSETTIAIYDAENAIEAYAERRFYFVQSENEDQVFKIKLDAEYSSVDISVKLDFGDLEVRVSDTPLFNGEPMILDSPFEKYLNFKIPSDNITLINVVYIKVSSSALSNYSLLVKPAEKFKELKAFKTELVYTSKETDQYLYFNFLKEAMDDTEMLTIEMYNVNYFSEKPELLFLSETDVTLNNDSPFIPMPLVDYYESDLGEFKHYQIVPELIPGYFIIKINKNSVIVPIKISVNVNGLRQIEPNGLYKHRLMTDRLNVITYEMYIHNPGEFRLMLQTCSDASIDSASFITDDTMQTIEFKEKFTQDYLFIILDKRNSDDWERAQKEMSYYVKRGVVDTPGLLQFNVTSSGVSLYDDKPSKLDYFLITEFKPAKRNLTLKDYVDVYTDKDKFDNFNVIYKFTDHDTRLSLKATLPKIKTQILQDIPKIKKVQYRIYYYMIAENPEFIEKVSRYGFAAVETVKSRDHMQEKMVRVKEAIENDTTFTMYFFKNDLEVFEKAKNISVYVQVEVYFFENEDEEFGISLDTKMTQVPYFLLTIPNYYRKFWFTKIVLITGASVLGVILIILISVLVRLCKKKGHERDVEQNDSRAYRYVDNSQNKLNNTNDSEI